VLIITVTQCLEQLLRVPTVTTAGATAEQQQQHQIALGSQHMTSAVDADQTQLLQAYCRHGLQDGIAA
jgi:hypothetical protein